MKFVQALKRVGIDIVKTEQKPDVNRVVLFLRIDRKRQALWNETLTEFLMASVDDRITWATDVSKYFYPVKDHGIVRYLWRVTLDGDPRGAAEALGRAAQRASTVGVEVKSQPLIGRQEYTGVTRGAHSINDAPAIVASAAAQGTQR